jgi:hypothetical protein
MCLPMALEAGSKDCSCGSILLQISIHILSSGTQNKFCKLGLLLPISTWSSLLLVSRIRTWGFNQEQCNQEFFN